MKGLLHIFPLIALAMFLSTCHKELEDYDANWKGEWHSRDTIYDNAGIPREMYLLIDGNNSTYGLLCEMGCNYCNCFQFTHGKARINKKHTKILIGSGNDFDQKIWVDINQEPFLNANGRWECSIEDIVMLKDP